MRAIPCTCGHFKYAHYNGYILQYCRGFKLSTTCKCYEYKADNLTYLQMKYEKKHS